MSVAAVLTFEPDGRVHGLYTEVIPLHDLGRLSIQRATSIEFDNARQHWVVRDLSGVAIFHAPSRQQCLDWERAYFNQKEKV